jgi:hypothetical protein
MATPITTMTFDNKQELLWTGNEFVGDPVSVVHRYLCG